jgi:hypothetical protein
MKNIYKALCFVVLATMLVACPNTDDITVPPPRDYAEVYAEDLTEIEEFLDTHFVTVDSDYNTTFELIPDGGSQTPISSMSELQFKLVATHDITYKVYYLKLREGIGESPTRLDSAFVSYKGTIPSDITLTFDQRVDPVWFPLEDVVRGWGQIIPEFKTGTYTDNPDGSITFDDYGAGVMFIPSGLGYFNQSVGNIPSYSPLIFNFKLYDQRYRDHDRDKILSKYEYGVPDFNEEALDTDGDGLPDYLDRDDDGDGYLTKAEITKPTPLLVGQGISLYYPFDANVDEPKGIPDATGDGTSSTRLRRHLDKNTIPPYTTY